MVRNAGPPTSQLSDVNWTLSCYLKERSLVRMPSLARAGVALQVGRVAVGRFGQPKGT